MKLKAVLSTLVMMLIIVLFFEMGYSKTIIKNSFVCKERNHIKGKTEEETSTLRAKYTQELDSKMEKDKNSILSAMGNGAQSISMDILLLGYMKKIICMQNFTGVLDYFEDLHEIKKKLEVKSVLKKSYLTAFSQLSTKEQESIEDSYRAIEHREKDGDF